MNQSGRLQGTPKENPVSQINGDMDSSQAMEQSTKGTTNILRQSQMAFANDIAQGLIQEVRKLQTIIQEKDRLIKDMEMAIADGEKEKELAQRYLRQKTMSEEKLKEDNWNLEVANQDLQTNQSELNQTIAKLNVDHKKCLQDLRSSLEQVEIVKAQQEKATATIDAMKARHDHDQQLLRRNNGILHRDMAQLKKQLEAANTDLKICRSKLAIKATVDSNNSNITANHQQMSGKSNDTTGDDQVHGSLDDGDTTKSNVTGSTSGLAAISQQRALEIETLKQSLGHAHRMISSLRSNLQKEKVEKIEFKKLLSDTQESMDQLQRNAANHDASHTGRGQSKKTSGTNRTKVVRKRGAMGRKAVATAKPTHDFSGDNHQDFTALDSALEGTDDIKHKNNGVHAQADQSDFLSCDDDDTSVDDSSSADENNHNIDSDSGGENDCHQLDLSYAGQGQSLDMELKLGGFDTPFKPLSSELEESFTKRQYVDKGVNTAANFEQVSLCTWQQSATMTDTKIAATNNDIVITNSSGIDGICSKDSNGIESGDKSSENNRDIIHNNNDSVSGSPSSSSILDRCPLSSSTQASGNVALLDSMHSPIPIYSNTSQPLQHYEHQMDSTTHVTNAAAQDNTISQQEGMITPLPGSPVSRQQSPDLPKLADQDELQPLDGNTRFASQTTIPIIENTTTTTPDLSGNESRTSVLLANKIDGDTKFAACIIEQSGTDISLDNDLVTGAKQTQKTTSSISSISSISSNVLATSRSSNEICQQPVTPPSTQLNISSTSPPVDVPEKAFEPAILAPLMTDEHPIKVTGEDGTLSSHGSANANSATSVETNQESQQSSVTTTNYESPGIAMDMYDEAEPLDGAMDDKDNCQPEMDISNMLSRDEAEALIKAGIADALEKERVETAARQQHDLSNNFVTLAEAEAMARDRTEAALKKERDRTSTMLTKTQADLMARAYAEEAMQEDNSRRHSHDHVTRTTTTTTSSFLAKVKTTTTMHDETSAGLQLAQRRTSQPYMAPAPQPSTSTASIATNSSTSSRRSILSGLMKLQPSISTPAKSMKLRPSASTSSLRKTITSTSSSSSSSSKPPRTQRQMSNNALHQRYKATADQHLQPPPTSAPSYGTVRITETSTYPRKPSLGHQQGHLRKPSLHSLSSNMSSKSGLLPPSLNFPLGDGDLSQHSSAELISAITQTMIGEWMWKHTRKHMGGGISENKHKRFFWVHPYTRTLYWGTNEPGVDADEAKAKSAFIESVSSIPSSDTMGASPLSLLIKTAKRDLKLTAQSLERHELWRMSLSYLLVPPGEDYSAMGDVIQVDPFHHDPDTAALTTTAGSASTQTLTIPTSHDSHDDTIAKDVGATPVTHNDMSEDDEDSNSRIQDCDPKADGHDIEVPATNG